MRVLCSHHMLLLYVLVYDAVVSADQTKKEAGRPSVVTLRPRSEDCGGRPSSTNTDNGMRRWICKTCMLVFRFSLDTYSIISGMFSV